MAIFDTYPPKKCEKMHNRRKRTPFETHKSTNRSIIGANKARQKLINRSISENEFKIIMTD